MSGSHNIIPLRTMRQHFLRADGSIDVDRLKAGVSISAVAAEATELRRVGGEQRGLCPFHAEDTPSFYVNEGKGVWHCFGCAEGGDALSLFSRLHDEDFISSCVALGGATMVPLTTRAITPEEDAVSRVLARRRASEEWRRGVPIPGTLAETYLTSRALGRSVPGSLRFSWVPRFWKDDGDEGVRHPAMIAAAQDVTGRVAGIQRTFLDRQGRKVSRGEPRLALGRMRGCALRVGPVRPEIMLTAGTEDALALRLMFPFATVWAAFGDANLAHVELPRGVCRVIVCGDADGPGRAAVAAARAALGSKGIETDELFPRAGAKDFAEEWVLLHA